MPTLDGLKFIANCIYILMEKEIELPPAQQPTADLPQEPVTQAKKEQPVDPVKQAQSAKRYATILKLIMNKRQREAQDRVQEKAAADPNLLTGFKHYKYGSFCLQAGDIERAESNLLKAKVLIQPVFEPFTNLYMNLGNIEAQKKNYQGAIDNYQRVIQQSPHANPQAFAKKDVALFSKHLNSLSAFIDAHTNIAVMYVQLNQFDRGFEYCKRSLELKPQDSESLINFTDILRQLGKKEEAIKHSWQQIIEYTRKNGKPEYSGFTPVKITPWKCDNQQPPEEERQISILTVKWGARYNADYVNKLYAGIMKNTTWKVTFYCFTDDGNGLHPDIRVEKLEEGWKRWWGKVTLFNVDISGRKFYIDLDMIITGSLDELFAYNGEFATLRTGDLACEKNHKDGYNSSVMIWQDDKLKPVYQALKDNFDSVTKFIVRFDFWLEMTIENADYIQQLYPRKVIDFLADAKESLPQGSSIVCFARKPKPEDYPAPWVKEYWTL